MQLLKELRNKHSHFTTDDVEILRQWRTKLLEDSVGSSGDVLSIIDASITILNRIIIYNSQPNAKPIKSMKQIKKEYDNHEKLKYTKKHRGMMKIKVTKKSGTSVLSKKQRKRLASRERKKLMKRAKASLSKPIQGKEMNNFLIEDTIKNNKKIEVAVAKVEALSPNSNFQVSEIKACPKVTPIQEIIAFNSRIRTNKIPPKMAEIQRLMEERETNLSMGTGNNQSKKKKRKQKKKDKR